jgi:hypothetical protein
VRSTTIGCSSPPRPRWPHARPQADHQHLLTRVPRLARSGPLCRPPRPAVIGLTRSLAIELGARRNRGHRHRPRDGPHTPALGNVRTTPEPTRRRLPGRPAPQVRRHRPAIAFFTDPRTMFITGQVLIIDGGAAASGSAPASRRVTPPITTTPSTPRALSSATKKGPLES